jgi:hypothetical protein
MVASDGELYGHHQHMRDRFLARLVDGAASGLGLKVAYPALWLKYFPPKRAMQLREPTSWSCHHGVSRWAGGCACTPGDGIWKVNLRAAFNRLTDQLDRLYLEMAKPLVKDPWKLRDRYIDVVLHRTSLGALLSEMTERTITHDQLNRLHWMLEAQRERQRMFTSCGWFFEDFDRIEPKNNVAYAAQAVRLTRKATGIDLADSLTADLKKVVSPRSGLRGDRVFQTQMQRAERGG